MAENIGRGRPGLDPYYYIIGGVLRGKRCSENRNSKGFPPSRLSDAPVPSARLQRFIYTSYTVATTPSLLLAFGTMASAYRLSAPGSSLNLIICTSRSNENTSGHHFQYTESHN